MNRFISQKFRFYSFISIAFLLFVHGYNLQEAYLAPFSLVREPLTFTTFTEYLFANGLLRFRLPMLFLISGYIFAMQDYKPFWLRIRKRAKTLMVPYFIWSAVGLALTYLWQQFPVTAQAVREAQLDQLGDNRPYNEIGWGGVLFRWVLAPVSFQLWFVRSLFFYNLAYPLFRWALSKGAMLWFAFLVFLWITGNGILFFEGQGMFFFSLGIWLYKTGYPIEKKPAWFSHYISWLFFAGLAVIKTFMAFEFEEYSKLNMNVLSIIHAVCVSAGVLAIWYSGDAVVKWAMSKKWFVWAASFSFFLYAFHVPLLQYLTRIAYHYGSGIPAYRMLTYLLVPVVIFIVSIAVGALVKKLWPAGYSIATGGRGI